MNASAADGVEISPGSLCNLRCVFCVSGGERDRAKRWAPLREVVAALSRFRREGAWAVGFVGGEPTAYPGLAGAVVAARRLGYRRIAVCTNGVRLAQPGRVDALLAAGLTRVTLSLHSVRPEVEALLTGSADAWRRKVSALRLLARAQGVGRLRDGVSLNPIVCGPTLPDLEEYARVFGAEGARDVRFNFIWPRHKARADAALVPRYDRAVPRFLALLGRPGLPPLSFGGVPVCVLPASTQASRAARAPFEETRRDLTRRTAAVEPGRVVVGPWEEPVDHHARVPACARCPRAGVCAGPYESYVKLYGDGEFRPAAEAA